MPQHHLRSQNPRWKSGAENIVLLLVPHSVIEDLLVTVWSYIYLNRCLLCRASWRDKEELNDGNVGTQGVGAGFFWTKLFTNAKQLTLFASVIQTPDRTLQPAERPKCTAAASIRLRMGNMDGWTYRIFKTWQLKAAQKSQTVFLYAPTWQMLHFQDFISLLKQITSATFCHQPAWMWFKLPLFTYTGVNNATKIYQKKEFFCLEVRGLLEFKVITNIYLFIYT